MIRIFGKRREGQPAVGPNGHLERELAVVRESNAKLTASLMRAEEASKQRLLAWEQERALLLERPAPSSPETIPLNVPADLSGELAESRQSNVALERRLEGVLAEKGVLERGLAEVSALSHKAAAATQGELDRLKQLCGVRDAELLVVRQEGRDLAESLKQSQDARRTLEEWVANSEVEPRAPDRRRVCSLPLDPVRLTARLRAIEPSLHAEWENVRLTVYGDVTLSEPKRNAVAIILAQKADFT